MGIERLFRNWWIMALVFAGLAAGLIRFFPGYLTNTQFLGGLIGLELLAATVWNFRQRFLTVLLVVFLCGGSKIPFHAVWSQARWLVLVTGALAGIVMYMKDQLHWFGTFHTVAMFCILSSFASAVVSSYPSVAALKALSLLLLFVYGMTGARLALVDRETRLFRGLLLGCEVLIYASAISHLILHYPLLGNPNSLGAVMGVVVIPMMLWGTLASGNVRTRRRLQFALVCAVVLLLSSYARAGIVAATVGCFMLCFGLRQYKLFLQGITVVVVVGTLVALYVPTPANSPGEASSPIAKFLYKGHDEEHDVLESRRSVWDSTLDVIRRHPFFGTGFGTSATTQTVSPLHASDVASDVGVREHGNSYLAIMEWQGLLGVFPFLLLVCLIVANLSRVLKWMRRTGDPFSPAVPIAAVLAAGLVHACFEDWLFAVGYYLCVFFWTFAFMFVDVLPGPAVAHSPSHNPQPALSWTGNFGTAGAGQ